MDFDLVLQKCGNFSRYQFVLLLLFGYTNILSALHYFSQTLISFTPEHWCDHPKLWNLTINEIRIVYADIENPSCTLLQDVVNGKGVAADFGECHQWIYNRENHYESITTELNWVCSNSHLSAVGQSFYFIGSVIGTITFGYLSDRIGRMPAMILSTLSGAAGDIMSSFVSTLPWFGLSRLISGLSTDTMYYLMYIMVFEYLSPKRRTFGLNIIFAIFFTFGLVVSPWLAMWVGTWRKYLWITSLPALGVLLYPLLVFESAQWLLTKKHYGRAVNCLKGVAAFNGRTVEEPMFDEFVKYYQEKMAAEEKLCDRSDTFIGMIRTPRLRRFTITLLIKFVIITLSYDTISRNMEGLGSSPFRLFSYTSSVYILGGFTILLLQNIIGRKGMACSSFFVGAIITAATGFLIATLDPNENATLLAIMIALGRYGAVVAYDAECQYAAEIIPTSVRGRALSNIHVLGLASSSLCFYIIYLANYYKPLPSIFISCLMFCGSLLCLMLPETLHKKLPETLADGERFALDEKWYYFPCFSKRKDSLTEQVESNKMQD